MGYDRIKRLHDEGNHERCRFGCSPDNPAPSEELNFSEGYRHASRELAAVLGRADPRVDVAHIAREYLATRPSLPGMALADLEAVALMDEDLASAEPSPLDLLKVRQAHRLIEDCLIGVYVVGVYPDAE